MYVNNLHLYKVCTFLCILYISVTENSLKTPLPQTQVAVKHAVGVCKQVTGAISNSFKRRRDLVKAQVDLQSRRQRRVCPAISRNQQHPQAKTPQSQAEHPLNQSSTCICRQLTWMQRKIILYGGGSMRSTSHQWQSLPKNISVSPPLVLHQNGSSVLVGTQLHARDHVSSLKELTSLSSYLSTCETRETKH